jgi:hypothetical protein
MKSWPVTLGVVLSLVSLRAQADGSGIDKPDDPPPHEARPPLPAPHSIHEPHRELAPPPPPPPQFEVHLAALQGVLVGVLTIFAARPIIDLAHGDPTILQSLPWGRGTSNGGDWIIAVATPLVMGTVVCAVGNLSAHFRGSCVPSVVGAYLGTAAMIPLVFLGYAMDTAGDNPNSDVHLPIWTKLATSVALVVPGAASVGAWHAFSHRRPGVDGVVLNPLPLLGPARPAFVAERSRGLVRAPGERVVPVLSVGF